MQQSAKIIPHKSSPFRIEFIFSELKRTIFTKCARFGPLYAAQIEDYDAQTGICRAQEGFTRLKQRKVEFAPRLRDVLAPQVYQASVHFQLLDVASLFQSSLFRIGRDQHQLHQVPQLGH